MQVLNLAELQLQPSPMTNIDRLIWPFGVCYLRNLSKCLKVPRIYRFVLVCSEVLGAILCQMLSIYQEIQEIHTPYFVAIIKWFVYFLSDGNKLVDARVTCLKTGLIRSDQIILDEKFKHWIIEYPLQNFTADRQ